jgi:hypothetical protein
MKSQKVAKARRQSSPKKQSPEQERYVRDLLVRGEAAKLDEDGKLPLQATAVITKEYPDGKVEVKNVRKKLF